MNDVKLSLGVLDAIRKEAHRDDMTLAERAGLYAGAKVVCDEFRQHIDDHKGGDGYAHEKVAQYWWHIGATLGFDTDNGHGKADHLSWAWGALDSLGSRLAERSR